MKESLKSAVCILLFISILSFKCEKDSIDPFCTKERQSFLSLTEKEGTVGYSDKYKRYVVIFQVDNPNNIDESIVGFPCNLNKNLQVVGKYVTVNGVLKEFNQDENMKPKIAGQKFYFLELSNNQRLSH